MSNTPNPASPQSAIQDPQSAIDTPTDAPNVSELLTRLIQKDTERYNSLDSIDNPNPPTSPNPNPPFEDEPRPDPTLDSLDVIATLTKPLKPLQFQAIELLIAGHSDSKVAKALNITRVTVSRWRLYNHVFQAEFNRRRDQVFANASDRARKILHKALTILTRHLNSDDANINFRAAALFLKHAHRFAPPPPTLAPLTPAAVLDHEARKCRLENASTDPRTDPLTEDHRALALRKLRYFSAYHPQSHDEPQLPTSTTHPTPEPGVAAAPKVPLLNPEP